MQRDRNFADYQDDSAFYNRRPSIWVEPHGHWGLAPCSSRRSRPTTRSTTTLSPFGIPRRQIKAGDQLECQLPALLAGRLPISGRRMLARVMATRLGRGGVPGQPAPTDKDKLKFVVDFAGGPLAQMAPRYDVQPVVTASRGKVTDAYVIKVVGTENWRALFDLATRRQ